MTELLKASAVAARLGCSKQQVYRWTAEAGLPAIRIGRSVFFTAEAIDGWLLERTTQKEEA